MSTQGYRELLVWRKAVDLTVASYALARQLPAIERYGLVSQICRSAVSVPANIAEGNARFNRGSYAQFLRIARGSLAELETLVEIVARLGYVPRERVDDVQARAAEVSRLLTLLAKALHR